MMKAGTSSAALLPFVGALILARSEEHSPLQKALLGSLSVALGLAFVAGAAWVWSSLSQPGPELAARVEREVETLAAYVRSYRERTGSLPDAGAWNASIDSGDLRLIDPWGRPYRYEVRDSRFRLGTFGRDGAIGGERADADSFFDLE